jgi:hypothetical protein
VGNGNVKIEARIVGGKGDFDTTFYITVIPNVGIPHITPSQITISPNPTTRQLTINNEQFYRIMITCNLISP